jgi:hypothetical protein
MSLTKRQNRIFSMDSIPDKLGLVNSYYSVKKTHMGQVGVIAPLRGAGRVRFVSQIEEVVCHSNLMFGSFRAGSARAGPSPVEDSLA